MMSEKEEKVTLDHFIHKHPLFLIEIETDDKGYVCRGCFRLLTKEAAYGCKKCGDEKMLHQECVEMPRKIRHPIHPEHTLVQQRGDGSPSCALCEMRIFQIGYFCSSSICNFQIHLRSAPAEGMRQVDAQQISTMHPSHPEHELVLVKKRHSFKCDACGTMETGRSYQCIGYTSDVRPCLPQRLILTTTTTLSRLLSISRLNITSFSSRIEDANDADSQSLIRFPVSDIHEEVMKPFVIRERGEMSMPGDDQKHWFSNHHHQLSLVSSSSISEINDDEQDDDDDDYLNYGKIKTELICDACTMPIFQKQKHDPSSVEY